MAKDTEERYDIAFAGECLEGKDPQAVRVAVGDLFKADEATLERLFSGTRQRIKRNCDKATALKYQKSLAHVGAKAIITRASSPGDAPSGPAATATQGKASTAPLATSTSSSTPSSPSTSPTESAGQEAASPQNADEAFELLPGGSDILRPEERIVHEDAGVDLSHLSLAEAGETLGVTSAVDAPAVSVPELAVAEPGARMAPEDGTPPPPAPDTSALDLAPTGADLVDPADHDVAPPAVNTDHLNLAESGSDLLNADERPVDDAEAPDTSHLALDASDDATKTE
ncbi:hypothetical protein [Congregibacter litoralis]|uniref:Uncharacterized protein n=1 Tax=Congregibacter litoralis KT71 TaxID=314285 RepID=A4A3X9_9GAMM|nr:hypothetical protein [Congregibacter litoralis]EAQ99402.2 hypothetical protein KT71_17071 [Congregibacter litoralis KT71]